MTRIYMTVAVAGLAVAILGLTAQGQDRDKRPEAPSERDQFGPPQRVLDKLDLTAEQKKKIEELTKNFSERHKRDIDNFREDMRKVREEFGKARGDREALEKARKQMEDLVAGMRKLEDDLDSRVADVLNADQKKKFEEAKKELTGQRSPREARPEGKEGDRPGRPDRKEGDRPGRPEGKEGDRPGRPEGKGPEGRRGPGGRPDGTRGIGPMMLMIPGMADRLGLSDDQKDKLAKIRKEYEEKMMDVLTAEQKKQMEEMRNRFPGRGRGPGGPPGERPERGKDKDNKDKDRSKSRDF